MSERGDQSSSAETRPTFPDAIRNGSTVLVAGTVDPSTYALGLQALCRYGSADESALVVTTTESADETVAAYDERCPEEGPSIGVVDSTSERQYLPALYDEVPTVYTPSAADLERIVVGLSELTGGSLPATDSRHLVVRSVTPLLEWSGSKRVSDLLQRISGLKTGQGIGFFGVQYTDHDEDTIAALARQVDGILWVTEGSDRDIAFEFQAARRYSARSSSRRR